jgi:hypothetical protein
MGGVHMSLSHGIRVDLQYQTVDQSQPPIWQVDIQISPGPKDSMPGCQIYLCSKHINSLLQLPPACRMHVECSHWPTPVY